MRSPNLRIYLVIVMASILITAGILYGVYLLGSEGNPVESSVPAQVMEMMSEDME